MKSVLRRRRRAVMANSSYFSIVATAERLSLPTRCHGRGNCYIISLVHWTGPSDCRYRGPDFCGPFGAGGSLGGVAGEAGAVVSDGASVKTFLMNPGGTVAVRIARSPDCSTFRLSKNALTSASVPCGPTLPSAA